MPKNPILDEIRKIRDNFAKQYDYDLDRMVDALRQDERERLDKATPAARTRSSKAKPTRKSQATSQTRASARTPKRRKAA